MSGYLRSKKRGRSAPLVGRESNSSTQDCTQKRKRNETSSGLSQSKRKRKAEVQEREKEEERRVTSAADVEESGRSCSESSRSVSWDVEYYDRMLREELENKYQRLDCLGEGGFGSVYAAYRRADALPVAIKYVPIDTVVYTTLILNGELKEIPMEVALMMMMGDGEAASVALLDSYVLRDELVLVMERPLPSMDLFDYILHRGGHLQEEEAKRILRQLVEAMIHIHSKGVLHRDIKPENILVQTNPEGLNIRVLDFGCGCYSDEDTYTEFHGTPINTPPEWHMQSTYQAVPCTVWQTGVVLYAMLCGRFPFNTSTDIVSEELFIPVKLSQYCKDLLSKCLAKDPSDRPTLDSMLEHPWLTRT